ncbi:hypothetical protein RHSIM_Rhsim10G0037700 [Rhododendron simsii]|uniref:Zinc knuckle CX2CX4HX4C domain-containing protein n=1 Tax=Rhododendron simsii TaxID=118357 RepID=A0A834GBM2_RHOSS|nr:hypothetical protein RHSIM_Rhsim10G0037700 [Rhododendron simsii]
MHITKGAFFSVPPVDISRVCIEVEAAKDIPKIFVVNLGYGEPYEIRVELPWKHQACLVSKIFGHTTNACVVKPQAPPSQVRKTKEMVGQEVPVVKERIAKEPVGQVVPVVQERAAIRRELMEIKMNGLR